MNQEKSLILFLFSDNQVPDAEKEKGDFSWEQLITSENFNFRT